MRSTSVEVDGGVWKAVRPEEPSEPNGFSVLLIQAPRSLTAQFQPDRFAGPLVKAMAAADDDAKTSCIDSIRSFEASGVTMLVMLDGQPARSMDELLARWSRLDLECVVRVVRGASDADPAILVATACLSVVLTLLPVKEIADSFEWGLPEGAQTRVTVNRYERSAVNRATCLAHHGYRCAACSFDFAEVYGGLGSGYIEVHHLTPVSAMGGSYRINPVTDLVPLCANCHAMVHRTDPPLAVEVLRSVVERGRVHGQLQTQREGATSASR